MRTRLLIYFSISLTLASCQPENTPPVALVYSLPVIGDTSTVFLLEGKNSSDNQSSYFALRYRWDINADGIWDTEYSTRTSYTARFSKTGYQKFILEVADTDGGTATVIDSVFILSQNRQFDTLADSRDGKQYRIIKIGENWWMAENLRFGVPIQNNVLPTDNNLPEFFRFNNSPDLEYYGGLYTWVEANYYPSPVLFRDICPPGWRIPSPAQWSGLFKAYSQPFSILYYFGPSSIENLGIEMRGYYKYGDPKNPMEGQFKNDRSGVRYWTSEFTGADTTRFFTGINFTQDSLYFVASFNRTEWIYHPIFLWIIGYRTPEACYVRCIKQ